nr:hypothetical protein CFP56_12960 [Quercus suber]
MPRKDSLIRRSVAENEKGCKARRVKLVDARDVIGDSAKGELIAPGFKVGAFPMVRHEGGSRGTINLT